MSEVAMIKTLEKVLAFADWLLLPLVVPCALVLKLIRRVGVQRVPRCRQALVKMGVFPIRNHYYEPKFDYTGECEPVTTGRRLPGLDLNVEEQLRVLRSMTFADELASLPVEKGPGDIFYMNNGAFGPGDAEYWYQTIRARRPAKIIEIGSGYSTLIARQAIERNREEQQGYVCEHVCIEPYEKPWLEGTGASVLRKKVEEVAIGYFSTLERNDILFIDSSHVIRPGGDVLFEYLEALPSLRPGVIVHVHDIFTPRDYPGKWLREQMHFWNEQYLLEAVLSENEQWKVIGALNFLSHNHSEELKRIAPFFRATDEPGSFYIQRVGRRDENPTTKDDEGVGSRE